MYDINKIRHDFPILSELVNGKPVTYLDTAASAQKPFPVLNKMLEVYQSSYANPHRGTYYFADKITSEFENARAVVQHFINADSAKEIIFTRNATESINLVAYCWGLTNLKENDEILISEAEHHANIVPWQNVCRQTGAKLIVFPIADFDITSISCLLYSLPFFIFYSFRSCFNIKNKLKYNYKLIFFVYYYIIINDKS